MAGYGFAIPILPGMVERNRAFAGEMTGARRVEYDASRARLGITHDEVWMQETSASTMLVVHLKAGDLGPAFGGIATWQEPVDVWWRENIQAIPWIAMPQPLPGPMTEPLLGFRAGGAVAGCARRFRRFQPGIPTSKTLGWPRGTRGATRDRGRAKCRSWRAPRRR